MVNRSEIVRTTRRWIGTPYRHQAARRGAGADCLGLVRGVWREMFDAEPASVPAYSMDWSEPQGEERLWEAARTHLVEKPKIRLAPGDVILFRMRHGSVAKHLGIISETGTAAAFVHAYARHGVVESPLSGPWHRRIVAQFEFPVEVL